MLRFPEAEVQQTLRYVCFSEHAECQLQLQPEMTGQRSRLCAKHGFGLRHRLKRNEPNFSMPFLFFYLSIQFIPRCKTTHRKDHVWNALLSLSFPSPFSAVLMTPLAAVYGLHSHKIFKIKKKIKWY